MSDIKTERLLNLTMALLASRRGMTKSAIFQSVSGYSGNIESMERMFERDKDELRNLNIEIEVTSLDSYFDDEVGYRIDPKKYTMEMPDLSANDLALLSLAALSWRSELFSDAGQSALRKMQSLGVDVDVEILKQSTLQAEGSKLDLAPLWGAIRDRRAISFHYRRVEEELRTMQPYELHLYRGNWYLAGHDMERNSIRIFRVSRIFSVEVLGKKGAYELPTNFNFEEIFNADRKDRGISVTAQIRIGKATSLRQNASSVQKADHEDFELCELHFDSQEEAVEEILWHGDEILVESPKMVRDLLSNILREKIAVLDER